MGLRALAIAILLVGGQLGATVYYERCVGLEKKVEEQLASWTLEDDCVGYMVEYLEGEEPSDF